MKNIRKILKIYKKFMIKKFLNLKKEFKFLTPKVKS